MFELRPYGSNLPYNPFRRMEELEKRFFGGDFADFKTDVTDNGDSYLLEADLPGFDKNDIHLDVSGDTLTVSAERRSAREQSDDKTKYVHVERSYGSYSRAFDVSAIDTAKIRAKYENGVLKLTLPKKNELPPKSKHLEIE